MSAVLDASALLAYILREPGHEKVAEFLLGHPPVSSINLGETAQRLRSVSPGDQEVLQTLAGLPITVMEVSRDVAVAAGLARVVTAPYGLSMGDRVCLMLAKALNLPALTADRDWLAVADVLGVEVRLIR